MLLKRYFFILALLAICLESATYRIVRMIPFGDYNAKIIFDKDISDLNLSEKKQGENKYFIDFEADLTIPRRNFLFKHNLTMQVAQNTPQIVRIVLNLQPQFEFQAIKEKENLYIMFKPLQKHTESKNTESKNDTKQTKLDSNQEVAKKIEQKQNIESSDTKSSDTNKSTAQEVIKAESKPKANAKNKKIVIDAGHGGKDCGTTSIEGKCEKVIVLEVAQIANKELKKRGYVVFMTRNSDAYIDLRKRTEFANSKGADLFVSIHANSIPKDSSKNANGVETYFLSPARSERAEQVAKTENQGDIETMSHFATKTFLNTISTYHLIASHKLAIDIQSGILNAVRILHNTKDGAVREGPFWVLAGALMPSVLIEIGYASNEIEGKLIAKKEYQSLIAQGIADGIDEYFSKNY